MYGLSKGRGEIFENGSVESDCGEKPDTDDAADQYFERNHSTRKDFLK